MSPVTQSVLIVVVLAVNLGISGFFRARARRQETIARNRESRGLRFLRAGLALPMMAALSLYVVYPSAMDWAGLPLPAPVRWLGAAVGLGAALLNLWVLSTLGANVSETVLTKESHELVTHGPYRWVRHPLYSVGFLLLAGLALLTASVLVAALTVVGAMVIRGVVVPREERELVARFGERYRDYRRTTGALLPRLRPRTP